MYRKLIFTLLLIIIFTLIIIPKKETIISAFRLSNEPIVISKGNYGQSLIVEISFSHKGLNEWIGQLNKPYPLLMLDADWIERSPDTVNLIKKKNIPTGLYGQSNKKEFSFDLFRKEIQIYEKHFNSKPLWYMTSNYEYPEELKQSAFKEKINLLSPTTIYSEDNTNLNTKGAIISMQIHETSNPNFKNMTNFVQSKQFISIEENIFGYTMKSNKLP